MTLKVSILCLILAAPGSVLSSENACQQQAATQKDGYLVWDQTQVEDKNGLLNHLIDAGMGVRSVMKIATTKCSPTITPSFYGYNGANIASLLKTIMIIMNNKKASEQKLEAYLSQNKNEMQQQIDSFKEAAKQTEDAYKAARKREKLAKLIKTLKMISIAAAGVEVFAGKFVPGGFICGGDEAQRTAANEQLDGASFVEKLSANVERTSVAGSGSVMGILTGLLRENTPEQRLVAYGASLIIFDVIFKSTSESSDCLKQRADEYASMAAQLEIGYGTDGNIADGETALIDTNLETTLDEANILFTQDDFGGCRMQGINGLSQDVNCSCLETSTCFQISTGPSNTSLNGFTSDQILGRNLSTATKSASDFANGVFSGDTDKANLAADKLLSHAFDLEKAIKNAKEKINKDRVAKGQNAINFDKESQKLVDKMLGRAANFATKNGINSGRDLSNLLAESGVISDEAANIAKVDSEKEDSNIVKKIGNKNSEAINEKISQNDSFDFLNDFDSNENKYAGLTDLELQENLKNFKVNSSGISAEAERSIFKIITRRYLESGYPRLLERSIANIEID